LGALFIELFEELLAELLGDENLLETGRAIFFWNLLFCLKHQLLFLFFSDKSFHFFSHSLFFDSTGRSEMRAHRRNEVIFEVFEGFEHEYVK